MVCPAEYNDLSVVLTLKSVKACAGVTYNVSRVNKGSLEFNGS